MFSTKSLFHCHLRISPLRALRSPCVRTLRPISSSSPSSISSLTTNMPSTSIIEHIVLFKIRDSTDSSKINAMISNLRSLVSLDIATYLTAAPILRHSDDFGFTHLLHSRYRSKIDLNAYAVHPTHQAVIKANVAPICDDILAVDWVADADVGADPSPGSLVRITLAKPREGKTGLDAIKAVHVVRDCMLDSVRMSCGENFSPERAKGYEVGFLSIFSGVDESEAVEGNVEVKKEEILRPFVESVIVADYLVPSSASSL